MLGENSAAVWPTGTTTTGRSRCPDQRVDQRAAIASPVKNSRFTLCLDRAPHLVGVEFRCQYRFA